MIDFHFEIDTSLVLLNSISCYKTEPKYRFRFKNHRYSLFLWGDPILTDAADLRFNTTPSLQNIFSNVAGHYYILLIDHDRSQILLSSSLFSILPIYYSVRGEKISISNNPLKISQRRKISKLFLLETVLFNYPLFNNSVFNDVHLLPSNHYVSIKFKQFNIYQHTAIENLFVSNPKPWRRSAEDLTDLFISTVEKYLPADFYISALTGGFDGRTLSSCGLYYHKKFGTYSFGSDESKDIKIARHLSEKAGIDYCQIFLDQKYIIENSLKYGLDFILGSAGTASFTRAHYLYAAEKLSSYTKYLITGNFGSEIFRAFHIAGPVINLNIHNLFKAKSFDQAIENISKSTQLTWLNFEEFKKDWECLLQEIKTLSCFNPAYSKMSLSKKFYIFIFNEVFRKYFGAEMVNQFRYLVNRTPFLDIEFLRAIFQTELAGVYSDFFEHNPFKRFKGQYLYSHIIQKAYPPFGSILTDKGYCPDDLFTLKGKARIAHNYLKKKIVKQFLNLDPYLVGVSFDNNKYFFKNLEINAELFNVKNINDAFRLTRNKDSFYVVLSQVYFNNLIQVS